MRIIGGTAKGTKLYTLEGNITRPTLDRVKESLFNILQNEIRESIFLDLFSGSGAIGLEAASRGAKKVLLCDKEKKAIQIIQKNIEKTHLGSKVELYNKDFKTFLKTDLKEKIDIIYLDPPYETNYIFEALEILLKQNNLKEDTLIIIETDNEPKILKGLQKMNLEIKDIRKYGRASILFLNYKK